MCPSHYIFCQFVQAARVLRFDRQGNVAILTALTFPVFFGFVGLAVDVSQWSSAKNSIQAAADNAALSAAVAAGAGGSLTQVTNEGLSVAKADGFPNGESGVAVVVNNPPLAGNYTMNNYAYEVIIAKPQQIYFAGQYFKVAPTVTGRAVALIGSAPPCILAVDPREQLVGRRITFSGRAGFGGSCGSRDVTELQSTGKVILVE
jgi:type II secretory pathway pseudopilin PulG